MKNVCWVTANNLLNFWLQKFVKIKEQTGIENVIRQPKIKTIVLVLNAKIYDNNHKTNVPSYITLMIFVSVIIFKYKTYANTYTNSRRHTYIRTYIHTFIHFCIYDITYIYS